MYENPSAARLLHACSQLAYLDTTPAMARRGGVTVASLAAYYLEDPLGRAYLKTRFGGIEAEYERWPPFLAESARQYGDWRIADILNDNRPSESGFYGCSYLPPAGAPEGSARVVAFRGSELLGNKLYRNDYETDFALAYADKTPQQAMVDAYYRRYGHLLGDAYCLTGHSLGGNLAAYAALTAPRPEHLLRCIAFNAPGFNRAFLDSHREGIAAVEGRLLLYQNEFDLVSCLLDNPVEPIILASRFDPGTDGSPSVSDLLYPHSNFMYATDESGAFLPAESGEKCRLCGLVHTLSDLFTRLPEIAQKAMIKLLLDAIYSRPGEGDRARNLLEAALKVVIRHDPPAAAPLYAAQLVAGKAGTGELYPLIHAGEHPVAAQGHALLILLEAFASLAANEA